MPLRLVGEPEPIAFALSGLGAIGFSFVRLLRGIRVVNQHPSKTQRRFPSPQKQSFEPFLEQGVQVKHFLQISATFKTRFSPHLVQFLALWNLIQP
jgi:hypothetical protein